MRHRPRTTADPSCLSHAHRLHRAYEPLFDPGRRHSGCETPARLQRFQYRRPARRAILLQLLRPRGIPRWPRRPALPPLSFGLHELEVCQSVGGLSKILTCAILAPFEFAFRLPDSATSIPIQNIESLDSEL